ncbi:FtsX-like permease family protein, partial [Cecembia rubra]|uniref:FtsX-like permease family protein n=1 Tax=Cecembia rubra TaxID=1485585 RepID=UPI00271532AC
RAKEVGIRKTMGSNRVQLIIQFLSESFIAVLISFIGALFLLVLTIDFFNELAEKSIIIPFKNQAFWIISILFILLTGLLAGLYPAIYLSSFKPVTVLKGSVRTGRFAALPRKVLVIAQFSVAVILVLGTIMIHKQIEFAKNRPVGYDLQSLISLDLSNPRFKEKVNVIKAELIQSGTIIDVATSSSRLTGINAFGGGFDWQGKDPSRNMEVIFSNISPEFGKTLGWKLISGRDFSEDLTSDEHDAIIINQAAAKQMGLENPIGTELIHNDEYGNPIWSKTIIGVVQDIVVESPYQSVKPTIYYFNEKASNVLHFKLKPELSYHEALSIIETTLQKIVPLTVYDFIFVDEEFSKKFKQEVLLGKLSGVFAGMAVFISSLGLFGLSSFVAEQRKKEIGIRKVMGASATNIWSMLSREFILLVLYACIFAVPPGYILVNRWLQRFDYHIEISLQLIILTCLIAVLTTLLTVSYQSVKAAWMNPTRSLRNE